MSVFLIKTLSMSWEKIKTRFRGDSDHLDSICCIPACRDVQECSLPLSLDLRCTRVLFFAVLDALEHESR